jgi:hypothetical protein
MRRLILSAYRSAMRSEIAAKGSALPAMRARVEQDHRERAAAGDPPDDGILWQN